MKIVVAEPLGVPGDRIDEEITHQLGHDIQARVFDTKPDSPNDLVCRIGDADVLVVAHQPLDETVLNQCKNLKMISVAFSGVDHIDLGTCRDRGIVVCNSSGYATTAVTELVFALAIDLLHHVVTGNETVRQGGTAAGLVGREISGKTFGIIGMGAIGLQVAMVARAFGANVIAWNRTPKAVDGVTFMDLQEVLKQSDILSLHLPLTPQTRGFLNGERLGLMKKTAVLINTARGGVVDSMALAAALESGALAGAGLDVFDREPPLDDKDPLLAAPHTVLTPHIGFATHEAFIKRCDIAFGNIRAWRDGTPRNVISI